ncbi:hypothetical protein [Aliarcobacter trophiarum]|uniref:hypothetical protein n=1 Tax=Aliarcobacter trophiarum TaxID=708186 RepID=UPI00100A8760|nr:hypothetical protein [Aliarcobacter trophiarum]RXI27999.1 hypothetical protein CRU89_03055 [Aliarcobacter trophiarum]
MAIICKKCSSNNCVKAGLKKLKNNELQRYKCNDCKSFFTGYEKFHHLNDDSKSKIINSFKENKKLEDIAKENSVYLRTIQYTIKNNLTKEDYETIQIKRKKHINAQRSIKERYMIRKYYNSKNNT